MGKVVSDESIIVMKALKEAGAKGFSYSTLLKYQPEMGGIL